MDRYEYTAQIRADGTSSAKITITKGMKALELQKGDYVKVTLEKVQRWRR